LSKNKIAIVGVGNLLLKDEGVGVHVVWELQRRSLPSNILLIDGGTSPDALAFVGEVDKLIIIDAVRGGGESGTIYRLTPDDIEHADRNPMSLHEWELMDSLKLSSYWTEGTEVVIIGVEPAEMEWGLELSAEVEARIPRIIEVVLEEVG
jgi:hydrogenase maturation protease